MLLTVTLLDSILNEINGWVAVLCAISANTKTVLTNRGSRGDASNGGARFQERIAGRM